MIETDAKGLFWRFGMAMFRYRKLVVVLWVILFLALVPFAQQAPGLLKDNGFTPTGSESDLGFHKMKEELGIAAWSMQVVYESDTRDLTKPGPMKTIMDSLADLKKQPYVADMKFLAATRLPQSSSGVQTVSVMMNFQPGEELERYDELKKTIEAPEGMRVYVTGGTPILHDMQEASQNDIVKSEMIGLPIALIVLLLVFGTLLGALLPMIVGLTSVTVTLGITYFIAGGVSLSNFLPNIVSMLGLAVGIDYALFMVSRFREELKLRDSVGEAVAMTCQKAGRSIFYSGIAVLIGLIGMLFIDLNIFRSLCLGGVIVVSVSVAIGNTLLLALFGLFGHKINAWRIIPKRWSGGDKELEAAGRGGREARRFWEKVAYAVMKRPVSLVVILGALLIYCMLPLGGMKLGMPEADVLPPSYESRYGSDLMDVTYDKRELNPIQIAVTTKEEVWEENSVKQVDAYVASVKQLADVKSVRSYLDAVPGAASTAALAAAFKQETVRDQLESNRLAKGRTTLISIVADSQPDDERTDELVRNLRKLQPDGMEAQVTGGLAYRLDMLDRIRDAEPYVVLFVMGVTYIVLFLAFRSVVLPLKAVLMNVLSLGASLGIVVSVFQNGHFAELLQITSTGYVMATVPIIIFCVVFGISMDYEVFLLSRIAEEYEATGDNERSTAEGLMKTGSLITSAAFILIVVVGAFILTDNEIMKALGLGLSLAVLIDATLIRLFMVPALMKLLGRANWWAPRWARRRRPDDAGSDASLQ